MTWKYGLKKSIEDNDSDWFELAEMYSTGSYTEDSIKISGESVEEVIEQVEIILGDLKELTVIDVISD